MRLTIALLIVATSTAWSAEPPLPPDNFFGLPAESLTNGGTVILGGGGRLDEQVYQDFIRLAGGKSARIVLIPSGQPYDNESHLRRAFGGWRDYSVASFDFLHTDDPEDADTAQFTRVLERATGVWIAGGTQGRLIYRYGERRVEQLIRQLVARGGVVGGTSAGASVMSALMIRYGSPTEAVVDRGFGVTSRIVIDQHFSERGRFPRLLSVLEEHPGHLGIGLDENTAAILKGNQIRVVGAGRATLCIGPRRPGEGTTIHRLKGDEQAELYLTRPASGTAVLDVRRQ
jgi:cyanophycinase